MASCEVVHGGRNKAGLGAVGALGLLPCGIQVARAVGHALLQGGGQTAQLARGFLVASDVGVWSGGYGAGWVTAFIEA